MKKFTFAILGLALLGLAAPAQAATATLKVTTCLQRSHNFTQAFLKTYLDPIDAKKAGVKLTYLGGPEVTPPERSGFGRAMLEKVVGKALAGDVTLTFPAKGVRCEIVIPAGHVTSRG